MRVWTDGTTHVIETLDGLTVQTEDSHHHEAGAPSARWCARVLGSTVPADCVAVAHCPDGRVVGVRMPSRRAGARLMLLRQADEGWVWGQEFAVPKAVRTDFRDLWLPGNAPFSRGRKLGQGQRGVTLTSSPWGVCLADHGTGIITALRKGADELAQPIRVPTQPEVQLDAIATRTGFLVQLVVQGREGVLVRFGPTGAHRGAVTSTGAKGPLQVLADGSVLHAGLFEGEFGVRRVDPANLEVLERLATRGLDQVDVATGVSPDRSRFMVCDGRVAVVGTFAEGAWSTSPLDVHIGEAPKAADPPVLSLKEFQLDLRPGPFTQPLTVVNRGGPCHGFVLRVSAHDAVTVERVDVGEHSVVLFENRKTQAREARFDNLEIEGDFRIVLHGEARLVCEAPLEVGLFRPAGDPYATGTMSFRINGADVVQFRSPEGDLDIRLSSDELAALVDVMKNLGVVDTDMRTPDLNRWTNRVCRRMRVDEPPPTSSPSYESWQATWMRLTARDRRVRGPNGKPPLFKFAADHPWHVTPEECESIVEGLRNVPNETVQSWVTFAEKAAGAGGFLVMSA
jgi:hypothetical protein